MPPVLLNAFLAILRAWIPAFVQSRSGERAVEQAVGALLALGRRTLSRSLLGPRPPGSGLERRLQAAQPRVLENTGLVPARPATGRSPLG